jgi:putative FmdB family regulatory protein
LNLRPIGRILLFMPIYQYVSDEAGCPNCRNGLELLQRLSDASLATCPQCGGAVHRVISAPQVISGQSHRTSESHAGKHGFTQYRRSGKGVYEKTVGKGPAFISGE